MLKRKLPLLAAGHHPLSSTVVFSMMTFISRVLGYLRDSVIMISFGAGTGADAFLLQTLSKVNHSCLLPHKAGGRQNNKTSSLKRRSMLKRKLPLLAAGHHPLSSTVVFQ